MLCVERGKLWVLCHLQQKYTNICIKVLECLIFLKENKKWSLSIIWTLILVNKPYTLVHIIDKRQKDLTELHLFFKRCNKDLFQFVDFKLNVVLNVWIYVQSVFIYYSMPERQSTKVSIFKKIFKSYLFIYDLNKASVLVPVKYQLFKKFIHVLVTMDINVHCYKNMN